MGLGFNPQNKEEIEEDDFDRELDSIGDDYEPVEKQSNTGRSTQNSVPKKQTKKKLVEDEDDEEYEDDDEDDYEGGGKRGILRILVIIIIVILVVLAGYKVYKHVFDKSSTKTTQTAQQVKPVQASGGEKVSVSAPQTQQTKQYPNSLALGNASVQPASQQTVNGQPAPVLQTGDVVNQEFFKSYDGSNIPTDFKVQDVITGLDSFQYKKVRTMTAPGLEKLCLVGTYHERPYSIPVTFSQWQLLPASGTVSVDVEELVLQGGKKVVCNLQVDPKYIEELQQSQQVLQTNNNAQ